MKVGDKVVMNDKYYVHPANRGKVFTVRTEPREICGTMAVFLEEKTGCYASDGLTVVNESEVK